MVSPQPVDLSETSYDDEVDVEQHGDSQTPLLSHHGYRLPLDDGVQASRRILHNSPIKQMLPGSKHACDKLNKLWSPQLNLRKVTWIPGQFWDILPRVVTTDRLLPDKRSGIIPPIDEFQKIDDPQALSREEYSRYHRIALQVGEELSHRHRIEWRKKLVTVFISSLLLFVVFSTLIHAR